MTTSDGVTTPPTSPAVPLVMICLGLGLAVAGAFLQVRRNRPLEPRLYRVTQGPHHG